MSNHRSISISGYTDLIFTETTKDGKRALLFTLSGPSAPYGPWNVIVPFTFIEDYLHVLDGLTEMRQLVETFTPAEVVPTKEKVEERQTV